MFARAVSRRPRVRLWLPALAPLVLGCGLSKPEPAAQAQAQGTAQVAAKDHGPVAAARPAPPALVVVIVVDQMRYEMLERFGPQWEGGFRRLLDQGLVFDEAHHAHATTYTAPGHASLATGTYASKHGIAANEWPELPATKSQAPDEGGENDQNDQDDRVHYAAKDPSARALVPGGLAGGPAALRRDTLGDWLRTQDPASQVWSIAMKDRAAIMLGGHQANGVLWWDVDAARHSSSTRYFDALPQWAVEFDAAIDLDKIAADAWTLDPSKPPLASRSDEEPFEGKHDHFPHRASEHKRGVGHWLRYQPRGDAMTFELALKLIDAQALGTDAHPDLLWLGASSGDWLGHRNGPRSVEIELYYRALDLELGEFLDGLDARARPSLVVLTSDHGVADVPQPAAAAGRDALRFDPDPYLAQLQSQLRTAEGCGDRRLRLYEDRGIRVRTPGLEGQARDTCLSKVAAALQSQTWCAEAFGAPELEGRVAPRDSAYFSRFARSHVPGRSPEIALRLQQNYMFERGYKTGTAHGSVYTYDTHVPLIFMQLGAGEATAGTQLEPGHVAAALELVDLAPTLARWLALPLPEDLDGSAVAAALPSWAKDNPSAR